MAFIERKVDNPNQRVYSSLAMSEDPISITELTFHHGVNKGMQTLRNFIAAMLQDENLPPPPMKMVALIAQRKCSLKLK